MRLDVRLAAACSLSLPLMSHGLQASLKWFDEVVTRQLLRSTSRQSEN